MGYVRIMGVRIWTFYCTRFQVLDKEMLFIKRLFFYIACVIGRALWRIKHLPVHIMDICAHVKLLMILAADVLGVGRMSVSQYFN